MTDTPIAEIDLFLAMEAAKLAEAHGGAWGEHPDHLVEDWRNEAGDDYTRLGYWEWVAARIENADET